MAQPVTIAQESARVVDPHLTTDRRAQLGIRFAVFDALVGRDGGGRFVPALSTGWTLAPDARTWTFDLRPGVRFHDGTVLSAEVAAASLARALDPGQAGELGTTGVVRGYLEGSAISATDGLTLRVVTPRPLADLLDLVVDLPIVSPNLAGSGPYVVTGDAHGVAMEAFAGCWRGEPAHPALRWVAMAEPAARLDALLAGDAGLVADVPLGWAAGARAGSDVVVREAPSPTAVAFLCNCFAGPCADRRVRRAINLGVDVAALIREVAAGDGDPLNGPLTKLHAERDPATPAYGHDPATARELLAEAGFGDGLALNFDVPTTLPAEAPALARAMAGQLAAVGVEVTIREHADREGYAEMVRAKGIGDAACFDSSPLSGFRVLREKLHGGVAGPWWQGYANPAVDARLDRAAATVDDADRLAIYREAYRIVRDDAPWVFLYAPRYRWAARAGLAWAHSVEGRIVPSP